MERFCQLQLVSHWRWRESRPNISISISYHQVSLSEIISINKFGPFSALFVAVSEISFLIPPSAHPARCGLLLTTLLVIVLRDNIKPDNFSFRSSRCWWTCSTLQCQQLPRTQLDWLPLPFGSSVASSSSLSPSSSMFSYLSTWRDLRRRSNQTSTYHKTVAWWLTWVVKLIQKVLLIWT